MSKFAKLKKVGKFAAAAVGAVALGVAANRQSKIDKKRDDAISTKQDLKKRAKYRAEDRKSKKPQAGKGGKVKFIRVHGRIVPVRQK